MTCHRVAYSKEKWSRGSAWDNLHEQQIPGCPKKLSPDGTKYYHGWVKDHTATEWAWVYWNPYGQTRGLEND